ncbi:MAG: hypothetical protein M0Z75_04845 [Nitrospiraceae bacterium]|nr:hypothetical protein [Nitrospiraceae bacterium]
MKISGLFAVFFLLAVFFISGCGWKVDPSQQDVSNNLHINNNDPSSSSVSVAGIWQGTYETAKGQIYSVTGIIDSSGEARFALSSGTNFVGGVTTSNASINGPFNVYDPSGMVNGLTSLSGSFSSAAIIAKYAMPSGPTAFYNGTLNVTPNAVYSNPADLASVGGKWDNTADGLYFSIDGTSGLFTANNTLNGCFYSGDITVPDSSKNVYALTLSISGCGKDGSYTGLGFINGDSFTYLISSPQQASSETLAKQ